MSQYTQENVIEAISRMYPDVDTSDVRFTKVRENITLHHPEYGTIHRTPESIFKSKSLNFNGIRIKAVDMSTVPPKNVNSKVYKLAKDALETIEELLKESKLEYVKDYVLDGFSISFYVPSLKYGINFNSALTCHTSNSEFVDKKLLKHYKDKNHNHNLWKAFNAEGITVFNIFDFYWAIEEKRPVILSKIRHGLGMDKKIYARSCTVTVDTLSTAEAKKFLSESHLEGAGMWYKNPRIFSMWYKDELVMVAVVGQYFEQGTKDKFTNKLSRIATKLDTTVVGGISKMTKAILKEYDNFHYLITLSSGGSSLNASDGHREIPPRYFWVDITSDTLPYYHRNYCQKSVLEKHFGKPLFDVGDRQCTEREYMESLGFVRVYDNGLSEIFLAGVEDASTDNR